MTELGWKVSSSYLSTISFKSPEANEFINHWFIDSKWHNKDTRFLANNDSANIVRVNSSWWRHQMEKCSALLAICARNPPVTGEFPSQRPARGALKFSLICTWTNVWVNNRDAGDLRPHSAHYDVTVMLCLMMNMLPKNIPWFMFSCYIFNHGYIFLQFCIF